MSNNALQFTSTINVGAGSYCVTITDFTGCISTSCITVNQNSPIGVTIHAAPIICSGATTDTITAIGSGGQAPYSYSWSTGEVTQSVIKPLGTYSVILSDVTGNSCFAIDTVTITEALPITITMSSTDVSCFGVNNGSALVYASGGIPG